MFSRVNKETIFWGWFQRRSFFNFLITVDQISSDIMTLHDNFQKRNDGAQLPKNTHFCFKVTLKKTAQNKHNFLWRYPKVSFLCSQKSFQTHFDSFLVHFDSVFQPIWIISLDQFLSIFRPYFDPFLNFVMKYNVKFSPLWIMHSVKDHDIAQYHHLFWKSEWPARFFPTQTIRSRRQNVSLAIVLSFKFPRVSTIRKFLSPKNLQAVLKIILKAFSALLWFWFGIPRLNSDFSTRGRVQ